VSDVFVDTSGWVALKDKRDDFWKAAFALNRSLLAAGTNYVTSNFVLDEAYTLLLHRVGHHVAVQLGEDIRASHRVIVANITPAWEEEAWLLFKRYSDKTFSFTDCTSFVVMRELNIYQAFTNDHHFEQIGYQRLLE